MDDAEHSLQMKPLLYSPRAILLAQQKHPSSDAAIQHKQLEIMTTKPQNPRIQNCSSTKERL